jgi:hypothetical protein
MEIMELPILILGLLECDVYLAMHIYNELKKGGGFLLQILMGIKQ